MEKVEGGALGTPKGRTGMTIQELEQLLADYCVSELMIQGNLVTMKLGIGETRGDDPIVQGMGENLEGALNKAFDEAKRLCTSVDLS
jgi:hypothetical protein